MLEIKILKCLNVARISFILSIIVYQEVSWKYIHIFCTLEKLKKKFLIDAHTNTGVRIYWHARFRQKLVIFLQGAMEETSIITICPGNKIPTPGTHWQPSIQLTELR